jgi:hypothetical protein
MTGRLIVIFILLPLTAAYCGTLGETDFKKTGLTLYGGREGAGGVVALLKNSTGVKTGINTNGAGYTAFTQHKSGSRVFGASSRSQSVYTKKVAKGVFERDPAAADVSSFAASEWSAQPSSN